MFTLDYTSIFLILLNVFVFVLFIVLIYAIFQSIRSSTTTEQELVRQDAYKKALETLDKAREEALRMVRDTEYLTDDTKAKMKDEFDSIVTKLSSQLSSDLTAAMEEESSLGVASIRRISKTIEDGALVELRKFEGVSQSIEKEALHELEEFKKELHKGTLTNEEAMKASLATEYADVKKRLGDYEQSRMSQIDKKIATVLAQVTQEIFDKAVDISVSEQLVIEALSKAKRENMFI